jgi:hypothetical protein
MYKPALLYFKFRKPVIMKIKIGLFYILLAFSYLPSYSQYTTPGNNLSLSLNDLVNSSGGTVSFANGTYFINNTLTISATDTLKITTAETIRTATAVRIEVAGTIISNPLTGKVLFSAVDTTSAAQNFKGFRFEDSNANLFRNTDITHGGGLQLISSEAMFEYCTFRKNGPSNVSAAITYSGCNPVIKYCHFIQNERSAIGSGANVLGSPQIMYNSFVHNTTDNSNRPQINLGPGGADTLYIVGNYVEGLHDNAGGIGISNLVGAGNTKAVIRDNFIVNNRYGYAQIGNNISAVITDNILQDNNIQNQPMIGGSGLNFQAAGTGNTAIIRRNIISGNLWGVTIIDQAQPNFGTGLDQGRNVFFDNGNSGQTYALYNNTALTINAIGNYWGTNEAAMAETFIFHQPDDPSLGLVNYQPIWQLFPRINSFAFLAADNPQLSEDVYGTINLPESTVEVLLPAETNPESLVPTIGTSLGVNINPASGLPQDFSQPVVYSLGVPHGDQQNWTVNATVEPETFAVSFLLTSLDTGLPLEGVLVVVDQVGELLTNADGMAVFEHVAAGTYSWEASLEGYYPENGSFDLVDQDIELSAALEIVVGLLVDEVTSWSIHPNPASNYFSLKLPEHLAVTLQVVGMDGSIFLEETAVSNGQIIRVADWPSGSYLLILNIDGKLEQMKFLKK